MVSGFPLRTQHYQLRPLTMADATDRYLSWLRDPDVIRFLEARHSRNTIDSVRGYVASHDNKNGFLLGIFTPDEEHVGNFSMRIDQPNAIGTLGVMIGDRTHWGRDVIQETRAVVLDWSFDTLGLHKVCGACLATNLPAVYNYRRQGWFHEGTRREQAAGENGKRVDVVMFGMLASDWKKRRAARESV